MKIIPAIDLKNNKCVRLTKGEDETSTIFNEDPEEQAIYFQKIGCKKIHIVDLDAAFGRPEINYPSIKKIRKSVSCKIQLGGGIRTEENANKYFSLGIDNLIIGSMSINQPSVVKKLAEFYKNKIYVSLDIKDNSIMIKGWKQKSFLNIEEVLNLYRETSVKGYVITDIKNDGMLDGLNTEFIRNVSQKINTKSAPNKKIIIAGGLTNYDDLENLINLNIPNIEGVISGKSFYVGNIDLVKAQEILKKNG